VESVRWYEALVFCNTLSRLEELTPVYRINRSTDTAFWGLVPGYKDTMWNAVTLGTLL